MARALASRTGALAALSVLVLGSLWLRTRGLRVHLWVDEGLSVGIARHPLSQIPSLLRQDGSPPLYYMLLHVWMALRGSTEIATHELSLIFSLLTIPAAYWAGTSLSDRKTGLICGGLAAGVPYLTAYGQETRMYALLALLALIVAASFTQAFARRRRAYLPVFAASLTAALYTHNWSLFLGLSAGAAFLLCVRECPRDERAALLRDGAIAFGAVAVMYAPWLPTVLYQSKHTGAPWALPPVVWSLSQGLYALVGGRGAAVALLLGGGTGLMALARGDDVRGRTALVAKCLLVLGLGTLLVAFLYAKTTPAWAMRYLAVIVGPLLLLFGVGLSQAGRLGLVALVLTASFWVLDPVPDKLDFKSNVATAIARVRADLGTDPLVLSTQPEQTPTIDYYLRRPARYGTPLGPSADPRMLDWRDALERFRRSSVRSVLVPMLRTLAPGQRIVLVVPINLPRKPLWMALVKRSSSRWLSYLEHDPALRQIASASPDAYVAGLAVRATVFERR
jgi:hypothetical protein